MHYHIVGLSGAAMSAIAQILLDQGHTVSGSDVRRASVIDALEARGVRFVQGHDPAHVAGADALLVTAALPAGHVEVQAARAHAIPVLTRRDLWRTWSRQRSIVAVAGTHGKTTTTALIALVLVRAGRDPGFMVGGDVPDLGCNARWGDPAAPLVIEADEYDRAFLSLSPAIAVITNIEWDHVDIYPSPEVYDAAFRSFAASVADPARLVVCGDDVGVQRALNWPEALQYGIDELVARDPVSCRRLLLDWMASNVRSDPAGTSFDLWRYDRTTFATRRLGALSLRLAGAHNVRNALAALAVASLLDVPLPAAAEAIASYGGAGRRFELKGEGAGVTVIDDYAHHPTEVRVTLEAARARYPGRRLVVYLQPHTYSRTRALLDGWATAFAAADVVRIGAVYAAREVDTRGIDDRVLAEHIQHPDARAVGSIDQAVAALSEVLRPGDVLLTLGAGDGNAVGERILRELAQAPPTTP